MARNLAGSCVNRTNRLARLLPCSAIRSNFVSFIDKTAISALAKIAFKIINTICTNNKIKTEVLIDKPFYNKFFQLSQLFLSSKGHAL